MQFGSFTCRPVYQRSSNLHVPAAKDAEVKFRGAGNNIQHIPSPLKWINFIIKRYPVLNIR